MYGPEDELNLKKWKEQQLAEGKPMTDDATGITEYPPEGVEIHPGIKVSYNPPEFPQGTELGSEAAGIGYGYGYSAVDASIGIGNTASTEYGFPQAKPQPDLNYKSQKYQEDKGIADLKDYVSSTYSGHYTNKNSDTQTLDLIHSVGDAESFCRSNALKYLSRYDKKGSAKQDILKAMHYCLLLYYFSGNTKEPEYTNTRYETF
tara:strand:+ start:1001 stop:1612 length:612 start_codon:yes stop_codon:yes gene_type:complete